ncbi:hypothetical protein [Cognatilysobacter terrigena]|uniref:hypothetical protein n=1 Tax=Cognatilysobacter terrigena TaxID=2488749 RepID=UPI001060E4A3|nr:hypothetical protein [Lysobacter terrigena]
MTARNDDARRGEASGSREPYSGPSDGRTTDNRLNEIDARDGGESLDDHQRDRASRGVADGYNDSVGRRKGEDDRDRLGVSRGD